ncbi:MAG: CARDB domain-containing protein, partial [Thermoplasmata archaeon]
KTFVVMDWIAKSGNHTFSARLSTSEKEENEVNNVGNGNYMIGYSELSFIDFQASPMNATDGEKVTIFARFMNIGKEALERAVDVELFIEGKNYGKFSVYGMLPSRTYEFAFTWQATPGQNEIAIYLARDDPLFELKTDNYIITTLNVAHPDILVSDILDACNSNFYEKTWLFVKLDGLGNFSTGGFSTRMFYVEIYNDAKVLCRAQVYGLAPGRSAWVSFEQPNMNMTIKIIADSTNIIKESIETNNLITKKIPNGELNTSATKPDVTIMTTSYHQSNVDGANIENRLKLNVTIANIGEDSGKDMRISILCDGIQVGTISVGEVGLGEKNYEFTFSPSTRAHRIKIIADSEYNLAETTETNNYAILFVPQNTPPFVMLTTDRIYAEVGAPVSFIADGLDNDDGVPTYFAWDFDGDGKFDWESNMVSSATFIYKKNGTYLARLYVLDSKGASAEGIVYVFVSNPKPKPPKTEDYKQYWITLNIASLLVLTGLCYYIVKSEKSRNGTRDRKKEMNKRNHAGLQSMNKNKVDTANK